MRRLSSVMDGGRPGVKRVCGQRRNGGGSLAGTCSRYARVERRRTVKERVQATVNYAVTSLSPTAAGSEVLHVLRRHEVGAESGHLPPTEGPVKPRFDAHAHRRHPQVDH